MIRELSEMQNASLPPTDGIDKTGRPDKSDSIAARIVPSSFDYAKNTLDRDITARISDRCR